MSTGGRFGSSVVDDVDQHRTTRRPHRDRRTISYWNGSSSAAPARTTTANSAPRARRPRARVGAAPPRSASGRRHRDRRRSRARAAESSALAPHADGIGSGDRRTVRIGVGGDLDTDVDVVALAAERIDGPVREQRRSLEAGRRHELRAPADPRHRLVSVTSPMVAPPTPSGGVNDPMRIASRSGSTSLSSTSITTGVPGPVWASSTPPTGGLFVASAGSRSTTTVADVLGAVPVDDRVLERVGARRSPDRVCRPRSVAVPISTVAVAGQPDRRDGDRLAIGVVVVRRSPGPAPTNRYGR